MSFFRSRAPARATGACSPLASESAPLPENEAQRLTALYQLRLLDTAPEERFDRLTRLAAASLQAPIALLSLVDGKREWFKSVHGLSGLTEIPRAHSFGAYAITSRERPFVVPDVSQDRRFAAHPLAQGPEGIRFVAGCVLSSSTGHPVGMLCVLGYQPQELSPSGAQALADLALLAEQELRGLPLRDTLERLALAERRAEEQHARFAAFMDNLPNVAFIKDSEVRTIFANPYHEKLFGVRFADVYGKRDDEWLPPEIAAQTMAADREVLKTGKSLRIVEDIPTAFGRRHWLTFKFPVPTPSGEHLLGGIAVDMTAQKEAEQKLEELLALQNALVNSANVAIVSVTRNGLVRTFNAAAERMLGYRAEEVIDRLRPEIWHDPEELRAMADEIQRETGETIAPNGAVLRWGLRHGAVAEHELTHIRKDGSTFHGALSVTALQTGGETTGYIGIIQDITARRETEEVQRRAKEDAEDANRAKSQFVANMSHEIRTPLNGILGITTMLLETELAPRQRQLAELVLGSAQSLLSIVNDILDFSKIEAGRLELEAIDFDLPELLRSLSELHGVRASERDLHIETQIAPNVPTRLHGDTVRLRQVLHNLLGNAIKFSENGTIRIVVEAIATETDSVRLRFDIRDCGIGIPREKLAQIFKPFTQADVSTTRLFGGTGLGLSICRQLVELMGGTIGVESHLGRGSDFWFTIPFQLLSGAAPSLPPAEELCEPMPRLRVLLAEDSAINRLVTTHQLQKLGCDVSVVENGQQAIEATATTNFDVILMDCQMPVMDGYAATAVIRERERGEERYTRIVAITANAFTGERERCLAAGMDGYLSKPFKADELYRQIDWVVRRAGVHAEVAGAASEPLDSSAIAALHLESRAGEQDFFSQYVEYFCEDIDRAERDLAAAEASQNAEVLAPIAHRVRGAAANFGARHLMDLCARMEKLAHSEQPAEAMTLLAPLRAEFIRVREALLACQSAS
ncbi:MAG: ATP-binding protein [Chthoniobacter sp.]